MIKKFKKGKTVPTSKLFQKVLFTTLFTLTLTSCNHTSKVGHSLMQNRFESPEAIGKRGKGQIHLNYSAKKTFTQFSFDRNEDTNTIDVHKKSSLENNNRHAWTGTLAIGAFEYLDLSLNQNHDQIPYTLGLKYQFYGSPRLKKENGLKMSLKFEYGSKKFHEEEKGQYSLFFSDSYNLEKSTNLDVYGVSFNLGRRVNSKTLFYFNNILTQYNADSTLKIKEGVHKVKTTTQTYNGLLGVERNLNKKVSLTLEGGVSYSNGGGEAHMVTYPVGTSLKIHF